MLLVKIIFVSVVNQVTRPSERNESISAALCWSILFQQWDPSSAAEGIKGLQFGPVFLLTLKSIFIKILRMLPWNRRKELPKNKYNYIA